MEELITNFTFIIVVIFGFILIIYISALPQAKNNLNMINGKGKSIKRKKQNMDESNPTVTSRTEISANWQKFITGKFVTDQIVEKPAEYKAKQSFTGTFRRARKKVNQPQVPEANNNIQKNLNSLSITRNKNKANDSEQIRNDKRNNLTKFIAMDCEMVGIGFEGKDNMLARISLVNKFGDCIYDKFVKPREEVKDYRTSISGVRKEDLINGTDFSIVQKEVADILRGRILVGHSLRNDFSVLFLSHPKKNIRDTASYKPFKKITKGGTPSLKRLTKEILGVEIQSGEHNSVEDARATMKLYCIVANKWEDSLSGKRGYSKKHIEN